MKTSHNILLVAMAFSVATQLPAQDSLRMSLTECLRMADANNLSLRSSRLAVDKAKDMQATAFEIEKTEISLSQDPTSGGSPDNALTVSQTFEFPTVYGARRNKLKAETDLERGKLALSRNELHRDVSAAYYELLYAVERRRILEKQAGIYERFRFIADAKLKAGETGKLEWMNAERLNRENKIALENAEKDVLIASYSLSQLLNTDNAIMPADDSLRAMAYTPSTFFDASTTPEGLLSAQRRTVSEHTLKVARQGYLPDISLSASTQMPIKAFNPYDVDRSRYDKGNFMGFSVGVSVPLFYGSYRAKVKSAKHDVAIAETMRKEQIRAIESNYRKACEEYRKAEASLSYFSTQGSAQADEIERISQTAYEKGEIGYVEYVQNLQTALDIHNQYATAINNFNQAVIKLNYIQGTER